jgi:phospholipid transport system substrate-binding protein
MNRRTLVRAAAAAFATAAMAFAMPMAHAADEAPDAMIKRLSDEVLQIIRTDKLVQTGDINRIMQVVDSKVMPNVNFERMTASAVGPAR